MKSKAWIIVLIIGIFVGIIGIVMLISGITIHVPSMGDSGWFEASSKQSGLIFGGIFITVLGLAAGSGIAFAIRASSPEYQARLIAKQKEKMEAFKSELKKHNIDPNSVKQQMDEMGEEYGNLKSWVNDINEKTLTRVCEYCGGEFKDNKTVCPYCGAKSKSKK